MSIGQYIGSGADITKILYRFDDNMDDSSGNNMHATNLSAITYVSGFLNQMVSFNGTSSYALFPAFGTITTFSTSLWIKTTRSTVNGVLYTFGNTNDNAAFAIGINGVTNNKIHVDLWNGSTATRLITLTSVTTGALFHIVYTHQGTNSYLYVNGQLEASSTTQHNLSIVVYSPKSIIGKHFSGVHFQGQFGELVIDNVLWSDDYVRKIYTNGIGRFGAI